MSGLQSMNLNSGSSFPNSCTTMVEGHCITERTPAADSIQKIGGIEGLRVTMHKLGVLIFGVALGSRRWVASAGRVDGSRRWHRVDGVVGARRSEEHSGAAGRRHFLFMNLDVYYPPLPLDILEVLTRGLVERVCDGRLEEGRAAEIAIRRAWILLECNVSLPLTPADADRVYGLIHYRGL